MSNDKSHLNGTDPVENGVNGTEDIEMADDSSKGPGRPRAGKDKDGDEEMTVVVPPSKGSKLSGPPEEDEQGDVVMNGTAEAETAGATEPAVDPKAEAVEGQALLSKFWKLC
jgi:26S proteasome regulatory subunit N3